GILAPASFGCIGVEIRSGDMVVRPDLHAAKAAEIAFRLIGADALVIERNRVIDPAGIPTGVKRIPSAAFVGVDGGESANPVADMGNGIAFRGDDEGQ